MSITIDVNRSTVALGQRPRTFGDLAAGLGRNWGETDRYEQIGADYVAAGFPASGTEKFVAAVCSWGGRTGGRIIGNMRKWHASNWSAVAARLCQAHQYATQPNPDHERAIAEVARVKGLGVSYGSKVLKFLAPDAAVVLDKIIDEQLQYPRSPQGYAKFVAACRDLRDALNAAAIAKPPNTLGAAGLGRSIPGQWRVSDAEMAVFACLR